MTITFSPNVEQNSISTTTSYQNETHLKRSADITKCFKRSYVETTQTRPFVVLIFFSSRRYQTLNVFHCLFYFKSVLLKQEMHSSNTRSVCDV